MSEPTIREAAEERRRLATVPQAVGSDGSKALALRPDQEFWSPKQVAALNALGIHGAGNADLAVFQHYCLKTRLDPFTKQIYFIKRKTKRDGQFVEQWTIQVGIDGYRVIAQRAARNEGIHIAYERTIWYDAEGGEHRVWLDPEKPPYAAEVTIVKVLSDGTRLNFPGMARFDSYAAKNRDGSLQGQWPHMGDHMIEKCAEAFALRRAFPHDLGGMYVEEELQHDIDYSVPRPRARRAASQDPPEDLTVEGQVEPEGNAPTEPQGPPPDQPGGNEAPPPDDRKALLAELQAKLSEFGLGGAKNSELRRAVITGLLGQDGEAPAELVDPRKLASEVLNMAHERLVKFLVDADTSGADVNDALLAYANLVVGQVQAA